MSAVITPHMRQWCKDIAKGVRVKTEDPLGLAGPIKTATFVDNRKSFGNTISRPMLDKLLYRNLVAWDRAGQTQYVLALTKSGRQVAA